MSKRRSIQHKPSRDAAKSQEIGDLKRENIQLKRQLAKTRKQLEKAILSFAISDEDLETSYSPPPSEARQAKCDKCGGDVVELKVFTKTLLCCKACQHRKAA